MSSPWKKKEEPEVVVDKVLRRAEMGKVLTFLPLRQNRTRFSNLLFSADRSETQDKTGAGSIQGKPGLGGPHP